MNGHPITITRDYEGTELCKCCQQDKNMLNWTLIASHTFFDSRFCCNDCAKDLFVLEELDW